MKKIAFIGTGIMGKSMLRNLRKAGYEVSMYARHREKVADLISEGVPCYDNIRDCVQAAEAVITIVGYPADVEEVYFGAGGILEGVTPGTYVIDMTTSSPKLAELIYQWAKELGVHALDAPVTGGDTGAREGTLSILAGGEQADFEACYPLFEAMGSNINYQGEAGKGQHTKMVNQIIIAGTISGVCEALSYAYAKDLDLPTVLRSIGSGAAGSRQLDSLAPRILAGDFAPGFFIKHFIKDMKLAKGEAEAAGLDLSVLELVLRHYESMAAEGMGDLGTQALFRYYQEQEKK